MKTDQSKNTKLARLEKLKKSKIIQAKKITVQQLKNLKKHKKHRTYAAKKRIWKGEHGKFNNNEMKDYIKAYDANQIFRKKNVKDYKVIKEDDK